MSEMFSGAASFNQPLDKWNTSNVTNMSDMFNSATSFNQHLNDWDVSHVTKMSWMFQNAASFNQPLNDWNVSNVKYMNDMFKDSGLDEDNYSILLNGPCSEQWTKWLNEDESPDSRLKPYKKQYPCALLGRNSTLALARTSRSRNHGPFSCRS